MNVSFKIISHSLVRQLFNKSLHKCNPIPLLFIQKAFSKHFKFCSNTGIAKIFLSFHENMFLNWENLFVVNPSVPIYILNEVLDLYKLTVNQFSTGISLRVTNFLMQLVYIKGVFRRQEYCQTLIRHTKNQSVFLVDAACTCYTIEMEKQH